MAEPVPSVVGFVTDRWGTPAAVRVKDKDGKTVDLEISADALTWRPPPPPKEILPPASEEVQDAVVKRMLRLVSVFQVNARVQALLHVPTRSACVVFGLFMFVYTTYYHGGFWSLFSAQSPTMSTLIGDVVSALVQAGALFLFSLGIIDLLPDRRAVHETDARVTLKKLIRHGLCYTSLFDSWPAWMASIHTGGRLVGCSEAELRAWVANVARDSVYDVALGKRVTPTAEHLLDSIIKRTIDLTWDKFDASRTPPELAKVYKDERFPLPSIIDSVGMN